MGSRTKDKRLAQSILAQLAVEALADHALPGCGENRGGAPRKHVGAKNIEETRVGANRPLEIQFPLILQTKYFVRVDNRITRSRNNLGNVLAHSGNVSARSGRVSYGAFTFTLKTLIDFIDMIPVVNASVIIVFQLYLGNEHEPDGDADRKRQDFDKGPMAFWQKIHDDGFNRHSQKVYKMVLSTISPSKRWMTRWA